MSTSDTRTMLVNAGFDLNEVQKLYDEWIRSSRNVAAFILRGAKFIEARDNDRIQQEVPSHFQQGINRYVRGVTRDGRSFSVTGGIVESRRVYEGFVGNVILTKSELSRAILLQGCEMAHARGMEAARMLHTLKDAAISIDDVVYGYGIEKYWVQYYRRPQSG